MANDKPKLTRRRVLGGMATVGAAGALGAGSWAAFSDQANDIAAKFTAGTIDGSVTYTASYNGNQVGEGDYAGIAKANEIGEGLELVLSDVKPGDYGSVTFHLSLEGNDAWVASCLAYEASEGDIVGPEAASEANDETVGDLQENLLLIPFYSPEETNNFFDDNRQPDLSDYGKGTSPNFWNSREGFDEYENLQPMTVGDAAKVGSVATINWSDGTPELTEAPESASAGPGCILLDGGIDPDQKKDATGISPLQGGDSINFGYDWHLPFHTGNEAQSDTLKLIFSHGFYQVRHSDGAGPDVRNDYAPENTDEDNDTNSTP